MSILRLYCPFCKAKINLISKDSDLSYMWTGGNRDMVSVTCGTCKGEFQIDEEVFDKVLRKKVEK